MFIKFLFIISTLLTLGSALLMLTTKNIMHSCIFLLGSLIGVSGLYVTLGADFVAVTQLMVYVGGIVILMLFAVMLTGGKDFVSKAQSLLGLVPSMGNKKTFLLGSATALVITLVSGKLILNLISKVEVKSQPIDFLSTVEELGKLLISKHVLSFEISSVLLLGALIGAAIIARPRKEY